MAWIESHEELGDHHKTMNLAQQLGCTIPTAVGTLHLLWHYTLRVAWRDGDLSKQSPQAIARACWWVQIPDLLIKSLQNCGFLDGMKVHGWHEYASQIIYQRIYNETRRKERAKFPMNSGITAVSTSATKPNQTLPKDKDIVDKPPRQQHNFQKPTIQQIEAYCKERGNRVKPQVFFDHYESNGWKVGKNGMKNWQAAVRTWEKNEYNQAPIGAPPTTIDQQKIKQADERLKAIAQAELNKRRWGGVM